MGFNGAFRLLAAGTGIHKPKSLVLAKALAGEKEAVKAAAAEEESGDQTRKRKRELPIEARIQTGASIEEKKPDSTAKILKDNRIKVTGDDVAAPVSSFESVITATGTSNATTGSDVEKNRQSFQSGILESMTKYGYHSPTPVQMQILPILLAHRDALVCAPTGSGKTLAFLLPILLQLRSHKRQPPRALVVAPTRELALQLHNDWKKLAQTTNLKSCTVSKRQTKKDTPHTLNSYDILFTSPQRLLHAVERECVDLDEIKFLVLDEADRLFEKDFVHQTDAVLAEIPSGAQKSLFSATLPSSVENLARTVAHDPIRVIVGRKDAAAMDIDQRLIFCGSEQGKLLCMRQLFRTGELPPPTLVFCRTVKRAQALYDELRYDGVRVGVVHSERTRKQRDATLEKFRLGETWILIATEVLGRGVDVAAIHTVVNYDIPSAAATYIHRIGRTGRAGRKGKALTLYTNGDVDRLKSIVNVMKNSGLAVPQWLDSLPKPRKRKRRSGTDADRPAAAAAGAPATDPPQLP